MCGGFASARPRARGQSRHASSAHIQFSSFIRPERTSSIPRNTGAPPRQLAGTRQQYQFFSRATRQTVPMSSTGPASRSDAAAGAAPLPAEAASAEAPPVSATDMIATTINLHATCSFVRWASCVPSASDRPLTSLVRHWVAGLVRGVCCQTCNTASARAVFLTNDATRPRTCSSTRARTYTCIASARVFVNSTLLVAFYSSSSPQKVEFKTTKPVEFRYTYVIIVYYSNVYRWARSKYFQSQVLKSTRVPVHVSLLEYTYSTILQYIKYTMVRIATYTFSSYSLVYSYSYLWYTC